MADHPLLGAIIHHAKECLRPLRAAAVGSAVVLPAMLVRGHAVLSERIVLALRTARAQ